MKGIVLSLFDYTGVAVQPWLEAGHECWIVDIQHPAGITRRGNLVKVGADLTQPWNLGDLEVVFTFAFPPCDHLATSGARWFKGKGLRKLAEGIQLFATAAEVCEAVEAPYMIENPVSTISTYWRKPDYTFDPHQFTGWEADDNYTKKTCLWTGNGFIMPEPKVLVELGPPDNRIHTCPPGPDRKNLRSATPMGFARAVFSSNAP